MHLSKNSAGESLRHSWPGRCEAISAPYQQENYHAGDYSTFGEEVDEICTEVSVQAAEATCKEAEVATA